MASGGLKNVSTAVLQVVWGAFKPSTHLSKVLLSVMVAQVVVGRFWLTYRLADPQKDEDRFCLGISPRRGPIALWHEKPQRDLFSGGRGTRNPVQEAGSNKRS